MDSVTIKITSYKRVTFHENICVYLSYIAVNYDQWTDKN